MTTMTEPIATLIEPMLAEHEKNSAASARRKTGVETASKIDVARPVGLTYCERSRFCGSHLSTRRV